MSQRSVPPSPQEIQRSHDSLEGPLSPLLVFAAVTLAARLLAPRSFESLRSFVTVSLRAMQHEAVAPSGIAAGALRPVGFGLVALFAVAIVASLAQTRGAVHRGRTPRQRAPEGAGGFGVLVILGTALVLAAQIAGVPPEAMPSPDDPLRHQVRAAFDALLGALLLTGFVDFGLRYTRWRAALHLTPEEARRRTRDDEGDPRARALRREAHRALLLDDLTPGTDWHLISDGRALVVIAWRDGFDAPKVVLHAEGSTHHEIMVRAENLALPMHHRPDLVRALRAVRPGARVPQSLWPSVAALLVSAERSPRNS
ncbi:MAG: EscU/YscU/HrcU family type III secretion system export apparatus switch protein [Polyangiales bacterium]